MGCQEFAKHLSIFWKCLLHIYFVMSGKCLEARILFVYASWKFYCFYDLLSAGGGRVLTLFLHC